VLMLGWRSTSRRCDAFAGSVLRLLGPELAARDRTTLSRRTAGSPDKRPVPYTGIASMTAYGAYGAERVHQGVASGQPDLPIIAAEKLNRMIRAAELISVRVAPRRLHNVQFRINRPLYINSSQEVRNDDPTRDLSATVP
jgi:hypothetical protein